MSSNHDRQGAEPRGRSGVTCDQCGVVCPSAVHLARHLVLHDNDGPAKRKITYTCVSCNRKFRFLKLLTDHRKTCRSDARRSSLAWSAGGVSTAEAGKTTASSTFQCNVCGRQFTQCGALRRHERVHSGERPHVCLACGKRFTQKCTLDRHVMLVHDSTTGGVSGGGSTNETVRSLRQSRGGRGNRRGGDRGFLVATASAATDRAACTVSSKLQSGSGLGRRHGNDSATTASFAFDRTRHASSPPSLFSDEEGDGNVKSDSASSNNAPATGSKANSSLATDSFGDEDGRKRLTSGESTLSSSSESDGNDGVHSDSHASSVTSTAAAGDPRRPHKCAQCGFAFKLAAHLKQHVAALHSGGKQPYACDKCDRRFRTQGALHSHKVTHAQKMRYRCQKCGRRFVRKFTLQRHALMHGLKPFHRCPLCGQRFTQEANLQLHLCSTHGGERPHRCSKCDSRFATAVKLRRHVLMVHSTRAAIATASRQSKQPVSNDRGAEPLAMAAGDVAACGAELAQTDDVFMPDSTGRRRIELDSDSSTSDVTIVSAAGRSPSKANASGTSCASRRATSGMTSEMKDSFVCRICGTCFHCKRNLMRHEKAHIAPRLYGCIECGRCFTQRGNLNRHVRNIHQRPADKSSAAVDVSRSQASSSNGCDVIDGSRASVVANQRKPRVLSSAGRAKSGSKDCANRMVAGNQAKAVNAAKGGRRVGTYVSGEDGHSANTGAVEISSHGGSATASGSLNFDDHKDGGDGIPGDGLRCEINAGSDLEPVALSSLPSKTLPSTSVRESNASSDGRPTEHGSSLNFGDAVVGRLAKPGHLELWWQRGCARTVDRPNPQLELTVAETEPGRRQLPSSKSGGGAGDQPLSSNVCQVRQGTSDVVGSSESQAVCRQSSVAVSPRSRCLLASAHACAQRPLTDVRASASAGLGSEASGAQLTPSDADSSRSGGGTSAQWAALALVEQVASTSVAPHDESFGAQLSSSSSVRAVSDDNGRGRQVQEISTGRCSSDAVFIADGSNLCYWFVEESSDECDD